MKSKSEKYKFRNVFWFAEPEYDWIDRFREGLAPISKKGKWGYVNQDGKIVIKPRFDRVMEFSEGMAGVYLNNKWGFINTSGELLIEPCFDEQPDIFHEGFVKVIVKTVSIRGRITRYGFADTRGELVLPPLYTDAGYFSGGLAPVRIDNKYGYINKTGMFIIDEIFDHALSFSGNKALVCIKQKWGLIKHPLYANSIDELLEKWSAEKD